MTHLFIKNMVCDRCVWLVKTELECLGFHPVCVHIGEVVLVEALGEADRQALKAALERYGLFLLEDAKKQTVEAIKTAIIELVHRESPPPVKYSEYLAEKLSLSYPYLSGLFSALENTTVEHFILLQKVERIKELLVYNEQTVEEIAHGLGYSSAQYLANQFKKFTGMTPTQFRLNNQVRRRSLDAVTGP